ncbi:MAG: putative membrane protein [Polyangiales bacterium]|jgi:putative membrane protein
MIVSTRNTWLHTLFQVRGSTIVRTWRRLLLALFVSIVVTFLHESYLRDSAILEIDMTPFSLTGLALGIFLGFRNNTSYDRFWEGRKLWGRVVNASRTLTRQVLTLARPAGAEFHRESVYRLIAYVHALRLHLRKSDDFSELKELLSPEEVAALEGESNVPISILQTMGERFRDAWEDEHIDAFHLPVLEASLTELAGVQGGCERILATPIPFSYSVLLHRIVAVYCLTLPFGLVASTGVLTPFVVLLISYAFFGLDAVGEEIEDPFGLNPNDLPLDAITRMIEVNLRQRLGETELPSMLEPTNNVLT